MTRAPWDDPETYIRNSAIHYARNVETPLLIRQNDHDEATPFFQGVQYFNLLRGLRKPVVMLQYEGAGHATNKDRPEDELDFARRRLEFFDHFLKGRPAPTWWAKGTPSVPADGLSAATRSWRPLVRLLGPLPFAHPPVRTT